VSGGTATDTCLSTSTGSFTLTGGIRPVLVTTLPGPDTTVVDVTATTTYKDPAVTTPTFANLCVGDRVTTLGALVSGTLTATSVTIVPAQVQGIVASVTVGGNTSTAANSCGTADEAGSFTLGGMRPLPVVTGLPGLVTTVVVAVGTTYKDPAVATPSFANVCVGSRVIALGTLVSGSLAATLVTIAPPLNLSGGHGNRRGPGKS
jgi:hypothetical protein